MSKQTSLHVYHTFLYISLSVFAWLRRENVLVALASLDLKVPNMNKQRTCYFASPTRLKGLCQLESIRVEVMNYFTYASKFKIQLFLTVLTRDFLLSRPRFWNLRRLYRGNWVWIGDILIEFTERFLSGLPQFRLFVKKRSFKTISLVVSK